MGRPIKEILNSDINYFEKKVNKYKNQQITIKKELKELKKHQKRIKRIKEKFCTECRCNSEKIRIPG